MMKVKMAEHPLPKVRDALIPDSLTSVAIFRCGPEDTANLVEQIEEWVQRTGNLVVIPGPVSVQGDTELIALSYVPASRKNDDPGRQQPKQPSGRGKTQVATKSSPREKAKTPEVKSETENDALAKSMFAFAEGDFGSD